MKAFASGLSKDKDWRRAIEEAAAAARNGLGPGRCDAAVFFVSEAYDGFDAAAASRRMHDALEARASVGCNASGVIGDKSEIEMEPGVSVLAMRLDGVRAVPFRLSQADLDNVGQGAQLVGALDVFPPDRPRFIALADPYTCDIERLLGLFNDGYKGLPVIGGLASGGVLGAQNWLSVDGEQAGDGAVGLALSGDIEFDVTVAQGCRPVGKPFIVTKVESNLLYELAGKPAFIVLREILDSLSDRDREIAREAVFAGLAMTERHVQFSRGDFLIRNIIGLDPASGALVLGAAPKTGQTLQFHLRDAEASDADLREHLQASPRAPEGPKGALVVSCCGRGRGLYVERDHDIRLIQNAAGHVPAAGFFANGEIGPVGGRNFVHGYTSSFAILR